MRPYSNSLSLCRLCVCIYVNIPLCVCGLRLNMWECVGVFVCVRYWALSILIFSLYHLAILSLCKINNSGLQRQKTFMEKINERVMSLDFLHELSLGEEWSAGGCISSVVVRKSPTRTAECAHANHPHTHNPPQQSCVQPRKLSCLHLHFPQSAWHTNRISVSPLSVTRIIDYILLKYQYVPQAWFIKKRLNSRMHPSESAASWTPALHFFLSSFFFKYLYWISGI